MTPTLTCPKKVKIRSFSAHMASMIGLSNAKKPCVFGKCSMRDFVCTFLKDFVMCHV